MNSIFFLHIPKTAGTTLLSFIIDNISLSDGLMLYRVRENFGATRFLNKELLDNVNIIAGHIHPNIADHMRSPVSRITVLRNPISLVISFFEHQKREGLIPSDVGIAEYLKSAHGKNLSNIQTRWISGKHIPEFNTDASIQITRDIFLEARNNLRKYTYVGISEKIDETFDCLRVLFDWKVFLEIYELKNIGIYEKNIDNNIIKLIVDNNLFDIELYQEALLINEKQKKFILNKLETKKIDAFDRRIFIDMDDSLHIYGFHQREIWAEWGGVRWTTSIATIHLHVEILAEVDYVFKIFVLSTIDSARYMDVLFFINDIELKFTSFNKNGAYRYISNFKSKQYLRLPKLRIEVPFAAKPSDSTVSLSSDSRELGIAVKSMYIGPSDDYIALYP